ncbi:MAG TPA: GGDEF domain-containing protein [Candidatus Krumholzibacterium sp.]|nr:GGDEF domain-containing protein [Candidatus Krumholzibacterium sp.]
MHPGFEKDYRYLLTELIPRHLLSPKRLEGISDALHSGKRWDILRESWQAMEELADNGVLVRDEPARNRGKVLLGYRQTDRKARFSLEMLESEYDSLSRGASSGSTGLLPSVISGIISSLTLNGSGVTTTEKLESIMNLASHCDPGAESKLILFSENELQGIRESSRVLLVPREKVASFPSYAGVIDGTKNYSSITGDAMRREKGIYPVTADTGSVILVPLRARGTVYGILQVHLRSSVKIADEAVFNLHLIGQGILRLVDNNRHLEQLVSVDRLTGVNNRNYYETQLPLEMERAVRDRKALGFLIMDIDDFKQFNDRHGHDVGDEVLRMVAGEIRKHLRKIDLFFRFGGEEFIALLPGAGREPAERTAERLREVVSKTGLRTESGEELNVTVTIGGCVYPDGADNERDLFRKADRMLLEAKGEGKNRVKFFDGTR